MSRSWIRSVSFVLAAAGVAASMEEASAGDVTVQRIGRQIFVMGEDGSDQILLTSPAVGVLRIESQDVATTTVDGFDFAELTVGRADTIFFLLGDGLNSVRVESLPTLRRITAIASGAAVDDYTLDGAALTGDFIFNGGPGSDRLTLTNGASIRGDLLAFTGGGGDEVTVTDAHIGGSTVVALGDGFPNTVSLDALTASGPVVVVGGSGVDQVTITNSVFVRSVRLELGAGADAVSIGALNDFRGRLTARGGLGSDTFTVAEDSAFAQRVLLDGGDGDDIFDVGLARFAGPLRLAGGNDDDSFRLHEFTSTSRVLVEAGDGDDVVDVDDSTLTVFGGGVLAGERGFDVLVGSRDGGLAPSGFEGDTIP